MKIIILAADKEMDRLNALAKVLESKGLANPSVLQQIGIIIGECHRGDLAELKAVHGVVSAMEDGRKFSSQSD